MATLSAASLAALYWIVKIAFAVLAGIVSLIVALTPLRWRDQKRHIPALSHERHFTKSGILARKRPALTFAPESTEAVTKLSEVISELETGDLFLFSGTRWWSWIIRIATWSRMSHAGMIYRRNGVVYVAEVIERLRIVRNGWWFRIDKGGFQLVPLSDYVKVHPGQCYVAKVAPEFEKKLNRERIGEAIESSRDWGYGWCGIGFQILMKCPFVCVPVYLWTWKSIDASWGPGYSPYCSWADCIWLMIGGRDPVLRLAPQLTTPADLERTMLYPELLAVVPA